MTSSGPKSRSRSSVRPSRRQTPTARCSGRSSAASTRARRADLEEITPPGPSGALSVRWATARLGLAAWSSLCSARCRFLLTSTGRMPPTLRSSKPSGYQRCALRQPSAPAIGLLRRPLFVGCEVSDNFEADEDLVAGSDVISLTRSRPRLFFRVDTSHEDFGDGSLTTRNRVVAGA